MQKSTAAILALTLISLGSASQAQSLHGSRASMERQNQEAVSYGYTFLATPQAINNFVTQGHLIKVTDEQFFELHSVSYPYSRPEVKAFIERLSNQYYSTCGEKMIITSLTRPIDEQPVNAASDSVHPTGMAVDMRIPASARCRSWLERTLLSMERQGVLDATREHHPAHYHVAVFTHSYENYIASLSSHPGAHTASLDAVATIGTANPPAVQAQSKEYIVQKGDTLATIARNTGSSTAKIRKANGLHSNKVKVGMKLEIPARAVAASVVSRKPAKVTVSKHHSGKSLATGKELTHRVRQGETLTRIAARYGTDIGSIKRLNGMQDDVLHIGELLKINSLGRNSLASSN